MLHACQTRWLSLHQAVQRVLEQWQPLKMYFTLKESEERLRSIELIVKDLHDPSIYLYFNFLDFILPIINNVNLLFQRESPTIHLLYLSISRTFRTIGLVRYFCRPECLHSLNIEKFNPSNEKQSSTY